MWRDKEYLRFSLLWLNGEDEKCVFTFFYEYDFSVFHNAHRIMSHVWEKRWNIGKLSHGISEAIIKDTGMEMVSSRDTNQYIAEQYIDIANINIKIGFSKIAI